MSGTGQQAGPVFCGCHRPGKSDKKAFPAGADDFIAKHFEEQACRIRREIEKIYLKAEPD